MMEKKLQQLKYIQEKGYINMFDMRGVQDIAKQFNFTELEDFLRNADSGQYMDALNKMAEE